MKKALSTRAILICASLCVLSASSYGQLDRSAINAMSDEIEKGGWTFTVGENEATQYPLEQICGTREPADWRSEANFRVPTQSASVALPSAFDWRTYSGTTPIRNQGSCGSCWAFATVGALECAIKIREGLTTNLSEQWLLSCNQSGWTCDGGWYAHSYHGLISDACGGTGAVLETDFPYVAWKKGCACPYNHYYTIKTWAYIGSGSSTPSISEMKQAILEYGPISVSLYASNYFQSYHGGVFNYCTDGTINHSVVLVGWDDTQGDEGVWILRNSWGTSWGESGYMKIAYGCCQVGYAACYIDYRPVYVTATNAFGPAPLSVTFAADVPDETVTGYSWDFGDGETSTEANPVHLYDQPGCFSAKLTVSTSGGTLTKLCPNEVSAYADSLAGASVHLDSGGHFRMDISARNYLTLSKLTIPFTWAGSFNLQYDSFSVASARTSYFDQISLMSLDPANNRATIVLAAGHQAPLAAGEGLVASLWFTVADGVSGMNLIDFVGYGKYQPEFASSDLIYQPVLTDGYFYTDVAVSCCAGRVGDVNQSGEDEPTISDVSMLIDHLFISGRQLGCYEEADINQTGGTTPDAGDLTIGDVSVLIDYLFITQGTLRNCL